jgi:hypothetical protein
MAVVRIDAFFTSQIDPTTGGLDAPKTIGWCARSRKDKKICVADRGGKLVALDADAMACENLQRLFWERCSLSHMTVSAFQLADGSLIGAPYRGWEPKSGMPPLGKRRSGAMANAFGTTTPLFIPTANPGEYEVTKLSRKQFDKLQGQASANRIPLYLHDGTYLCQEAHVKYLDDLKEKAIAAGLMPREDRKKTERKAA